MPLGALASPATLMPSSSLLRSSETLGLASLAITPALTTSGEGTAGGKARDPERAPRGRRGGAASRMSGSQKRAARKEREALVLSTTLADDDDGDLLDGEAGSGGR